MCRQCPQLRGLPFLCSPRLHPSLRGSWSGATGTPGCWRRAETLGPAACAWHPPFSAILQLCQGWGSPGKNVAALGGPLCCCAHRWWVTPPRWRTGLAWGVHGCSPCPGGARPPKCQVAPGSPEALPWQVCPLGICVSLDPSHRGLEKVVPGDPGRQGGGSACPGWDSRVLPTFPWGYRAAPERLGVPGCPSVCLWAHGAGSGQRTLKGRLKHSPLETPHWHRALVPPQPQGGSSPWCRGICPPNPAPRASYAELAAWGLPPPRPSPGTGVGLGTCECTVGTG